MFYGELDVTRGLLRYSNAGHNYPLVRREDGSLVELREGGLPLGILENGEYAEGELELGLADGLLLFSDGISEALDPNGQEFGDERLQALWGSLGATRPAEVIDRVLGAVQEFRGPAVQSDDMTLVVVRAHRDG